MIAGAPGARERTSGFVLHHQARSVGTQLVVYREITCDQAVLTDASTAHNEIARVLRSARERSLPVYIELPRDMTESPTFSVPVLPRRTSDSDALLECADEIIERLTASKAGAIIVDVEIRRYGLEGRVTALARKLGLPVVSTFMGRGLLDQAPDVLLGTYLGAAGDPAITKVVEEADGSVADGYKRLFRIYLAFHVRGHRDELPVALDSLRHPDSRHGSPSLTASSALSSTLVHRRGDYHLRAVVPAL